MKLLRIHPIQAHSNTVCDTRRSSPTTERTGHKTQDLVCGGAIEEQGLLLTTVGHHNPRRQVHRRERISAVG